MESRLCGRSSICSSGMGTSIVSLPPVNRKVLTLGIAAQWFPERDLK